MRYFDSVKYLAGRTLQYRFKIIITSIIIILLFGMVNFWFSMKVMSGIRSYVGGESLWSKSQKDAVNYLVKYSSSHDQADYDHYLIFIKVSKGDRQAREELNKSNPNITIVKEGFIQGGNSPKDVNDLIFLYKWFRHVSYMESAIKIWAAADGEIDNLTALGNQIHEEVAGSSPTEQTLQNVYAANSRLTVLENDFSSTLGDGSRGIAMTLMAITLFMTCLLGALAVTSAVLIAKATVRLDRAKTEFVSLASHQLRTPLTAINWYAESLLASNKPKRLPKQQKQLEELYGASQRASRLVSDLLSVSRLDLGTYQTEIKSTDVNIILNTILKDLEATIKKKSLQISKKTDKHIPKIKLDSRLLTVVLENLISNSIKYTPERGKITISLSIKKSRLIVNISDTGIGIPKSQQAHIFEKLYRADNAKEMEAHNTGLGLYVCKAMVDRMGGSITFESVENKGTDFHVKIPVIVEGRSHGKYGTKSKG